MFQSGAGPLPTYKMSQVEVHSEILKGSVNSWFLLVLCNLPHTECRWWFSLEKERKPKFLSSFLLQLEMYGFFLPFPLLPFLPSSLLSLPLFWNGYTINGKEMALTINIVIAGGGVRHCVPCSCKIQSPPHDLVPTPFCEGPLVFVDSITRMGESVTVILIFGSCPRLSVDFPHRKSCPWVSSVYKTGLLPSFCTNFWPSK